MLRQKVTDLEAKLESRDTPWGRTNVIGGGRSYISSPDQSLPPEQSSSFPPMFLLDSEIFKVGQSSQFGAEGCCKINFAINNSMDETTADSW